MNDKDLPMTAAAGGDRDPASDPSRSFARIGTETPRVDLANRPNLDRHEGAGRGIRSLLALTRANERLGRAIASSLGFGLQELNVLIHIAQTGQLTPTEIGKYLDLPLPTVTALLDKLETSGLALRRRDSVDRRKVHVALTDAGESAMRWTHFRWRKAFGEVASEEIPRLIEDLGKLTAAVLDQASALRSGAAPGTRK